MSGSVAGRGRTAPEAQPCVPEALPRPIVTAASFVPDAALGWSELALVSPLSPDRSLLPKNVMIEER